MEPQGNVVGWVRSVFPDFEAGASVAHGAFHEVLLGERQVGRVLLGEGHRHRAGREAAIHAALPEDSGNLTIPRLLGAPVTHDGRTGYLITRVPGAVRDVSWDQVKESITQVLAQLKRLTPAAALPPPRAWCGGSDFPRIVATEFGEHLGPAHARAVDLCEALGELSAPQHCFVHGDFGPHNILWQGGRVCGLVDFDHATVGDPAIDVAPLVGFYGAKAIAEITEADTLDRAMRHRATLSLQVAAAAHLCERDSLRDHALNNFSRRWQEGTLYDPAGAHPGSN